MKNVEMAQLFSEATPYIQKYHGKTLVIKYGGNAMVNGALKLAVMNDLVTLTLLGVKVVLVHGGGMWQRTVDEVAKEYPEVDVDYSHIDAATIYLVTNPSRFDVIVTDNLFGDIITDEAGAVSGGIGLAASGNIDASNTNPSMFEPVHGSAPDIAGKGIADPTAAILSGAMMLRHLGREEDAQRIEAAVEADMANRGNGPIKTTEVGDRIAAALAG